jgi:uncharacterized Zn-binding protein involved in type VI secretion
MLAARATDPTGHPGTISGPGMPNVLIGGLPAALFGDTHVCTMPPTAGPHPPTPMVKGSLTVLIGGRDVARKTGVGG